MITDHNGANWTPTNGSTLTGIHTNVNIFSITSGYTCYIAAGVPFEVYAIESLISGTIDGDGRGYSGGSVNNNGAGPGGGLHGLTNIVGAGGGGYGGDGGDGQNDYADKGEGGSAYGSSDKYTIERGSGGGGGGSGGGWATPGGNGGASILISSNDITITGTITCNGISAASYTGGAGGGGAGGGILLIAHVLNIMSATLRCIGGIGGNGTGTSDGGGGAGGRIKGICSLISGNLTSQSLVTAGSGGPAGDAGSVGTIHSNAYLGRCDSTHSIGQTINFNVPGNIVLSSIILKASNITTSGACTLTIYDSPDKNINYGSDTNIIDTIVDETWDFSPDIRLQDGMLDYYIELTTGAADVLLYFSCFNSYEDGALYTDDKPVHGVDLYMKIYNIAHVTNPVVYNISNRDIKCNFGKLLTGAVHRINANGTGQISYTDFYSNDIYIGDCFSMENALRVFGEIEIYGEGHLAYYLDSIYPISSIPTLLTKTRAPFGNIQIQISTDGLSWYDISESIIDDADTTYNLYSDDVDFIGKTRIYFRFYLDSTSAAEVLFITLILNLDTSTAQIPVVDKGGSANTFRCDQDPTSSIDGTVTLYYNDAKYAG
jgi:hypothetical protein